MAVIEGDYDYISETLKGTQSDDLFIVGNGTEYLFGDTGVDTAQINFSSNSAYSLWYVPVAQQAVLLSPTSSSLSDYQITFFDGIEIVEFPDITIDLREAEESLGLIDGSWNIYQGTSTENIVEGLYSSINETLTSDAAGAAFVPGTGDASIIGSGATNAQKIYFEDEVSNALFNNDRVTISGREGVYSARGILSYMGIDGFTFFSSDGTWKDLPSYDLLNYSFPDLNPGPAPIDSIDVFRFYNSFSGVHFFTSSEAERNNLLSKPEWGYRYEGVAYQTQKTGGTSLYRFFNRDKGYHFMTASPQEANALISRPEWGYQYEGQSFHVSTQETSQTPTSVYRFYKPDKGIHFYSASESEANNVILNSIGPGYDIDNAANNNNLLANGWGYIFEGNAWYVLEKDCTNCKSFTSGQPIKELDSASVDVFPKHILGTILSDDLEGTKLSETIIGNKGSDLIRAKGGNDFIIGGRGADEIHGNSGNDIIDGSNGSDLLKGGKGADVFKLSRGSDTVRDFSINEGDKIALNKIKNYSIIDSPDGVLINAGPKKQLLLADVDYDDVIAAGVDLFVQPV